MPSRPRKNRSRSRSRSRRVRRSRLHGDGKKVVEAVSSGHGVTTNDWITGAAVLGGTAAMYYANKQRKKAKRAESEAAMLRQEAIDQASKVKNVLRFRIGFEKGERKKAEAELEKIQQKR